MVCQLPHAQPAVYGKSGHKALYLGDYDRQTYDCMFQGSDRQPTSLFLVDAARGRQVVTARDFEKLAGESTLLAACTRTGTDRHLMRAGHDSDTLIRLSA